MVILRYCKANKRKEVIIMTMGERIKELRIAKGYTQEELGKILGLKKAAIQKYEKGDVENIKRSKIKLLADALGVTPSYIMGWDNDSFFGTRRDDRLIKLWRQLPYEEQIKMLGRIEDKLEECATSEGPRVPRKRS
jgi:transcriptional regulator with XRE-family HTH domain